MSAIRAVLALPDDQLDYAEAKLAFDRIVDPTLDERAVLAELKSLEDHARSLAGPSATVAAKIEAVRTVIYKSGPWNDERPFAYDHSDPLGRHLPNKLLHNYLTNRLGQCVSMPILFLILADRLGVDTGLSCSPDHVFVRYREQDGQIISLETTSGAHPARTEWFRQTMPMTDRAIENGLYMRKLNRRESVALMAAVVVEHLWRERRYEEVIAACSIILGHDPRAGDVMVTQGSAYGKLLEEFRHEHPVPFLIPEHLRSRHLLLIERNNTLIDAAEALGWTPINES